MLRPKKDTRLAHRHAQTPLSFGAHPVLMSAKNQSENMVSDVIHVLLPVLCILSVFKVFGINPVRFYI